MASITNLRKWKNGEVFNARDYVYERDTIITQVNRLSALIEGDGAAVNLTVEGLTTNSITLAGQTITNFEEAGTKVTLTTAQPQIDDGKDGQIWIQFSD
jgi:asparagine N-glycosylation enzyme membrane subunit Stt3